MNSYFLQFHGLCGQLRDKAKEFTRHFVHRPIVIPWTSTAVVYFFYANQLAIHANLPINNQLGCLFIRQTLVAIQSIRLDRTKWRRMLDNLTYEILDSDCIECILLLYLWIKYCNFSELFVTFIHKLFPCECIAFVFGIMRGELQIPKQRVKWQWYKVTPIWFLRASHVSNS